MITWGCTALLLLLHRLPPFAGGGDDDGPAGGIHPDGLFQWGPGTS